MKNTIPGPSENKQNWSATEIVSASEKRNGLVQWWYNQTAIADPPQNASFVRRENARKSHLLSTIIFWLLVVFILFIPGCFVLPNHYVIFADAIMLIFCVIAIIFNRAQKPQLAGVLLTVGFEIALTMVIFTTLPLDEPSIQQYELFVLGELLCVSLLAPNSVFIVMVYNIAVICVSLFFQPHTAILGQSLQTQLVPILIRPIAVQIMVAFVSWLWVKSAARAISRADRAETVAKLEHELAEQREQLEAGIQQILQTHVEIANGNLSARAPLTQDNVLWQIARSLNNLLVRLQRTAQAEQELNQMKQAIQITVQTIQRADNAKQQPTVPFTGTELDSLVAVMQGHTFTYTPSPMGRRQMQPGQAYSPETQQRKPYQS